MSDSSGFDGAPASGFPFSRDYLDGPAGGGVPTAVREQVRQQIDELAQREPDAGIPGRVNAVVRRRWSRQRSRDIALVRKASGHETYVVAGEILVTDVTWQDQGVREYVAQAGLQEAPIDCPDLSGRLTRLVTEGETTVEHLEATVSELRSRGFAASLNHVTPLGGVLKPYNGVAVPTIGHFDSYGAFSTGDGTGARVAIVDTGIDATVRTDGWLTGIPRVTAQSATPHVLEANIDPLDADPQDGYLDVSAGHGTFVAGVIAQVAPTADISVYQALSTAGTGSELEVACAIVRAVRDGNQIVNLSLGTETQYDQPSLAMSAALDVVREIEIERGEEVLIVAAAGNFGNTSPTWPAAFRRVVSVGALTADMKPSSFSSRGWWVDCSAVGEGILSTYVQGTQSPDFASHPQTFPADGFSRWSGTSFAAPQIAGAVARLMHERNLSPRSAYTALMAVGKPLPDFGQAFTILPGV